MKFKKCYTYTIALLIVGMSLCGIKIDEALGARAPKSFVPKSENIFVVQVNNQAIYCAYSDTWYVGRLNFSTLRFTPSATLIAQTKKKLLTATGTSRTKLKHALAKEKRYLNVGNSACVREPSGGVETPTPTPTSTVDSGTPTPTPIPGQCFEGNGDTKAGCFGIPTPFVGNRVRGETYFLQNCTGCHGAQSNKSYEQLNQVFSTVTQMTGFRPEAEQDFVDIVAYLNRFST